MCTVIVSVEPESGAPVLLAGVRDEFVVRPWMSPDRHWPAYPGLVGGRDLEAGGTWLAADPAGRRVAALLN
ncbi:NRDE family protein, partial [Microbispora sp. NPDC049633]|uniref:NRDE family protein n=1 Tax=Microbispora sp. NPDC049633 TaxID=3154355 RepID=UPI0034422BF2